MAGTKTDSTGVTFPDATVQTTASPVAFRGIGAQLFTTPGANTFNVPVGVTAVKVTLVGGGGGGGGSSGGGSIWGGGGGGGGQVIAWVTGLTSGGTVTVTVGAGGTVGANLAGGVGGTSSFGSYASATGGGGGARQLTAAPMSGGGAGGSGSVSGPTVYFITNGTAGSGSYSSGCNSYSGYGGAITTNNGTFIAFPFRGDGAGSIYLPGTGLVGSGYGSGGGGGYSFNNSASGGVGTNGIVLVEY